MTETSPKRPAPFCIRLSADERAQLERDAGKMALGAYIKLRLFAGHRKSDRDLAARILARLGQSELFDYLDALDYAQRAGLALLPPELESALPRVRGGLARIREMLTLALGLRGGS